MAYTCPNGHSSEADDYCDVCGTPIDAAAAAAPAAGAGDPAAPATPAEPENTNVVCANCQTENPEGALFCEACGYDFTTGAMPRSAEPAEPAEGDGPDGSAAQGGDDGEAADGSGGPVGTGSGSADAGTGSDEPAADPGASADPAQPGEATDPTEAPTSGSAAGGSAASGTAAFEWVAEVWIDPDWYQTQEAEDPCPSPGLPEIMPLKERSVLIGRVSTSKNVTPEVDLSSDPGVSRRHAQLSTDGSRWFVEDLGSSNGTFVGPASGPLPNTSIEVGPKTELDDDDRLYLGAWTRIVVRKATPDEVEAYA